MMNNKLHSRQQCVNGYQLAHSSSFRGKRRHTWQQWIPKHLCVKGSAKVHSIFDDDIAAATPQCPDKTLSNEGLLKADACPADNCCTPTDTHPMHQLMPAWAG
jgi:hypothetical protein